MGAFGVRDVCDVVLKSLRNIPACRSITGKDIARGEPVVSFDSLKVSTLSGSSTTVYATGGSGNQRRMGWDGDREVLFHIEDALLTSESFALMSGAKLREREITTRVAQSADFVTTVTSGTDTIVTLNLTARERELFVDVVEAVDANGVVLASGGSFDSTNGAVTIATTGLIDEIRYRVSNVNAVTVHDSNVHLVETNGALDLGFDPVVDVGNHPIFIYPLMDNGQRGPKININPLTAIAGSVISDPGFLVGQQYLVDTYKKVKGASDRMTLTADSTSDYYKLEGSTVFYRESDGEPLPAHLTIYKVKPRTTFELAMNPTGDPAAFAIDFDAFPQKNVPGFEKCKNGILLTLDIEREVDEEDCDCTWEA